MSEFFDTEYELLLALEENEGGSNTEVTEETTVDNSLDYLTELQEINFNLENIYSMQICFLTIGVSLFICYILWKILKVFM